jgi:hypothetical protein
MAPSSRRIARQRAGTGCPGVSAFRRTVAP